MIKQIILILSITLTAYASLNQEEFGQEALLAHNLYRKIHAVPPLRLNPSLSKLALTRAQELANLAELNVKQNIFEGKNLGETVGSVGGFVDYNGVSATQLWYSVVSKFDEEGENSNEGASFTQIVWKSTQEVGFAIAKGKDGKFYFVAEYFPSGNIRGQYEDNVFQLSDELMNEETSQKPCPTTTVTEIWKKKLNNTVVKENILIKEEEKETKAPVEEQDEVQVAKKPELIKMTTQRPVEVVEEEKTELVKITTNKVPEVEETNKKPILIKLRPSEKLVAETTKKTTTIAVEEEIIEETTKVTPIKIRTTTLESTTFRPTTTLASELLGGLETENVMLTEPTQPTTVRMQEKIVFTTRKAHLTTPVEVEMIDDLEKTTETTTFVPKTTTILTTRLTTTPTTTTLETVTQTVVEKLPVTVGIDEIPESSIITAEDLPVETTTVKLEQEEIIETTRKTITTVAPTTKKHTTTVSVEEEQVVEEATEVVEEETTTVAPITKSVKKSKLKKLITTTKAVPEEEQQVQTDDVVINKPVLFKRKLISKN